MSGVGQLKNGFPDNLTGRPRAEENSLVAVGRHYGELLDYEEIQSLTLNLLAGSVKRTTVKLSVTRQDVIRTTSSRPPNPARGRTHPHSPSRPGGPAREPARRSIDH